MTKTNLNAKQTKTSVQDELLSACPSFDSSERIQWFDGVPSLPSGVSRDEFFDLAPRYEDLSRSEIEAKMMEDMAEAEAEANLGNSVILQAIAENKGFTAKYLTKLISHEEVRLRYRMMAFIKGALKSVCSWKSPVMGCSFRPLSDHVTIYHTDNDGKPSAKFSTLVHDNNTWVCPICSFNIAVGRAKEIREIVWHAKKMDYECYHMTVTMAHTQWDDLSEMLQDMKRALTSFWGQRKIKDWFKSCFVHRISAMEITKGFDQLSNGWHPHLHILLIGSKDVPVEVLQNDYSEAWIKALHKVGRDGKDGIALQISPCDDIDNYLTKLPCEIALNNVTKHGHGAHMTFFQMVNYAVNSGSSAIRAEIAEYVRIYYKATKGLHQLQKSRGIEAFFGIEKKTDAELANQDTEKVVEDLLVVDSGEWVKYMTHEVKAKLWILARRYDRQGIIDLLEEIGIHTYWDNEEDYKRYMNKFYSS